ncbi:glycine/D-amino acid oxidase (deaminating) [Serpentinimonas raichei]|uniref:D-amino-acid oxidase n=1 Tax=Serpentinimonas raichei TaxID=1458425 RepID=A0A060NNP3_9BURK|nr:FAD-dependent oxidoreductase [Serpentinimonas raichei]BAO81153.1 glycine/D-amino acid oxidase (deaminating) [Serpentinimonas raichei]
MSVYRPQPAPVLILGAGLMGRLLGVALARSGHPVTLHEARAATDQGAAAWVAAAMLAPLAEAAVAEANVVRMGLYALPRWRELIASLQQPVYFQQDGTLILWHRQDAAEATRLSRVWAQTVQQLPELQAAQPLDAQQLAALEPSVAGHFQSGIYLPQEGQLDNHQLLQALQAELEQRGTALHWSHPTGLEQALAWQRQHGGWVLDCRGLGAQPDWAATERPLRGVRGEVACLYAPGVTLQRPTRLLHPRYPLYIAPKQDHFFVVGATQIESEDLSEVSARSALELLSAAYAVHPGFGEARIVGLQSQCRPTLLDHQPLVRECAPQVLQINGLFRHGYLIGPAVCDAVLEYVQQRSHDLAQGLGLRFEPCAAALAA